MNNRQILFILQESTQRLNQPYDGSAIKDIEQIERSYAIDEVQEFKRDLTEAGTKLDLIYMDNSLDENEIVPFFEEVDVPLILFKKLKDDVLPMMVVRDKKNNIKILRSIEGKISD